MSPLQATHQFLSVGVQRSWEPIRTLPSPVHQRSLARLLYPKKFLVFKGGGPLRWVLGVAIAASAFMPLSADAGIWAILARFFSAPAGEVEEGASSALGGGLPAAEASALDAGSRSPIEASEEVQLQPMTLLHGNAIVAPLNPVGTVSSSDLRTSGQIFVYTVRPGDTLAAIAQSFDVSVNTILWANSISSAGALRPGAQLIILPVTGVRHEVRKGDTVDVIAKKYRANIEDILRYNGLAPDEELGVGTAVMVPDGELAALAPDDAIRARAFGALPSFDGYYARPITGGRRSRGVHGYNGVDLANSCGLPVVAAADGTVIITRITGWNSGYGRYVVIAHSNSTQTLYAHLKDLAVTSGQAVGQGALIGTIGSTGNSTGCHVHFEIRGARNPF